MNLAPRVQGRALPLVLVCVVSFEFCHRLQTHPSTPSRLLIPPDLSRSHSRALALALVLSAAVCMCT